MNSLDVIRVVVIYAGIACAIMIIAATIYSIIKSNKEGNGKEHRGQLVYKVLNDAMTSGKSVYLMYKKDGTDRVIKECISVGNSKDSDKVYVILARGDGLVCHVIPVEDITYIKENEKAVEVEE